MRVQNNENHQNNLTDEIKSTVDDKIILMERAIV